MVTSPDPRERTADAASALQRWERVTRVPLLIASGVFLGVFSWAILDRSTGPVINTTQLAVLGMIWLSFIVDVVVRLILTPTGERRLFLHRERVDVFAMILPFLRPFRMLRSLRRLPRLSGSSGRSVRTRVLMVAGSYVAMFVYTIALGVLWIERDAPGATIIDFGDAIWWACVTIATVGYGDTYPVTSLGRMLAVLLMMGGVAIIATASATLVSFLSERISQARPPGQVDTERRLAAPELRPDGDSGSEIPQDPGPDPHRDGSGET